jgi:ABC-type amino acid transport substrate-binding protein
MRNRIAPTPAKAGVWPREAQFIKSCLSAVCRAPAFAGVGLLLIALLLSTPALAAEKESVYDRVMRTQTIRCGYGEWDIFLRKDAKTGKMDGIYYDLVEQLGKNLGLKIEWAEQTGWGDFVAGLANDRYDAFCTVVGLNAERARQVDFLSPLFYLASGVFVKKGDTRFDNNLSRLNDPGVRLLTVEGDLYGKISRAEFPKAHAVELPQLATMAEQYETIATGKADAFLADVIGGETYMHTNPGKVQQVKLAAPFRALPASIAVKGGEYRFQRMLDIAAIEMINNGTVKRILDKYDPDGHARLDVARPYEVRK